MRFLVLEGSVLFGVIVILEFHRFKAFVDQIHIVLPDPARPGGTLKVPYALGGIASDPNRSRIIMGKSAEPAVLGLIRRARLACAGHLVIELESTARAPVFFHNTLKHTHHFSCGVHIINLGGYAVIGVDRVSFVVIDPADAGGGTEFTVIIDRAVS